MIEDLWESVLISAMKLPGIAVNRREFLSRELAPYFDRKVINEILDGHTKMKKCFTQKGCAEISRRLYKLSSDKGKSDFRCRRRTGWIRHAGHHTGRYGTVYGHVLALAQKLLYLYGWPDLQNGGKGMDDGTRQILTLFVGVAFGSSQAAIMAKKIAERLAEEAAQRIPQTVLGQLAARGVVEQAGKWIGVQIAKNGTGKSFAKLFSFHRCPHFGSGHLLFV